MKRAIRQNQINQLYCSILREIKKSQMVIFKLSLLRRLKKSCSKEVW